MNDLVDVSVYLNLLKRDQIFELGVVLGLHAVPTLDKLRYTQTFLCDMLAAWLQGNGVIYVYMCGICLSEFCQQFQSDSLMGA